MPTLTIRLPDAVLNEVNIKAKSLHISKNAYVHRALDMFNKNLNAKIKREKLIKASHKVRANSMEINNEFSIIENDESL